MFSLHEWVESNQAVMRPGPAEGHAEIPRVEIGKTDQIVANNSQFRLI
jgi:hypothetical protein